MHNCLVVIQPTLGGGGRVEDRRSSRGDRTCGGGPRRLYDEPAARVKPRGSGPVIETPPPTQASARWRGRRPRALDHSPLAGLRSSETFKLEIPSSWRTRIVGVVPWFSVWKRPAALDRSQPLLPMRPGQAERRSHDYKRHGTTWASRSRPSTSGHGESIIPANAFTAPSGPHDVPHDLHGRNVPMLISPITRSPIKATGPSRRGDAARQTCTMAQPGRTGSQPIRKHPGLVDALEVAHQGHAEIAPHRGRAHPTRPKWTSNPPIILATSASEHMPGETRHEQPRRPSIPMTILLLSHRDTSANPPVHLNTI